MGNCTPDRLKQRESKKNVVITKELLNGTSSLIFHLRFWPHAVGINLSEIEKCVEERVEPFVQNRQKSQITLAYTRQNPESNLANQIECKTSLKSLIYKQDTSFTCIFPYVDKNQKIWRFINRWTPFLEQDILKIGKTKFKLAMLVHQDDENKRKIIEDCEEKSFSDIKIKKCRQCFSNQQDQENPLLQPCKCQKALKFIHLKCLAKLLFGKIQVADCIAIKINDWNCEECKTDIKEMKIYKQLTEILLRQLEDVPKPFAILQNIHHKHEGIVKSFFILSFKNRTTFSIGRSGQADIIEKNDKFVSKIHCQIQYSSSELKVKDCESLHGTLMKLIGALKLSPSNKFENLTYKNMLVKIQYAFEREEVYLI